MTYAPTRKLTMPVTATHELRLVAKYVTPDA
jgi:hypothetical protein